MAQQLPVGVLQWLWNALKSEYHNPQATYSDAVAALSSYPSLQPRTDVYTYNNGQPALLLCLSGTLPVNFRGTVYRFPLKIWVPQGHPADPEGIMVFVVPGENMMIRPGQHVSADGRVYHPYLRDWSSHPQSSTAEFLRVLQDVFAREPPVIAVQQQQQQRPAPPPKESSSAVHTGPIEMPAGPSNGPGHGHGPNPPPKPPKPGDDQSRRGTPVQQYQQYQQRETDSHGPPLPPLPHERRQKGGYQSPQLGYSPASDRNGGPPLPPLPHHVHGRDMATFANDSPVSPVYTGEFSQAGNGERFSHSRPMPQSPVQALSRHQQQHTQTPPYPSSSNQMPIPYQTQPQPQSNQQMNARYQQAHPPPTQQYPPHPQHSFHQTPQPHLQQQQQQQYQQFSQPVVPKPAAPAPPPPDLLSDPFDVSLPAQLTQTGPPPPIPPNPEKEQLLHLLSTALVAQTHQKIQQNQSALPALGAQGQAMQEAYHRLQQELSQVEQLDRILGSNESILRSSMDQCDKIIAESKNMPEPPIDEVLVAPTLVQNQLWNLEAEIAGLKEVLWVLQRAVEAGRVGAADFTRTNRSLGRELFLKMALSRKIAKGLNLDLGVVTSGTGDEERAGSEGFYS